MDNEFDVQRGHESPNVERVSIEEIKQEGQSQEDEKTDELVDRIMQQILRIK